MQQNHDDLLRQVAALAERFSHLHTRLLQVANELHDPGLPPSEGLLEEIRASRTDFIALSDRILALAESLAVPASPTSEEPVSLRTLESLLRTVMEAEQKRVTAEQLRHHALAVLERVRALVHSDRIDFPPLLACQMKARDLYHAITDAPWPQIHADAAALAVGHHPLAELLAFVEGLRELDDDHWTALHDAVAHAFGKTLTVAAVRGKLHIQQEVTTDMPPATLMQDDETTILVEPQEPVIPQVVKQLSSGVRSEETATEVIIQRDPPPPVAGPAGPLEQVKEGIKGAVTVPAPIAEEGPSQGVVREESRVASDPMPVGPPPCEMSETLAEPITCAPPLPQVEIQRDTHTSKPMVEEDATAQPSSRFSAEETAQQMAIALLSNAVADRPAVLHDLIWRLICDDKIGIAFHLTCCAETLYPDLQPRLPSWLVRVIALGSHVRHAAGNIARLLKQDFGKFSETCFTAGGSEWNHAVRFLCAAATLRPALLAPDTHASTVLHALYMKEGLSQLYEYCEIIAAYGDQLQALDPNALKKMRDQAAWQAELDALRQEAETWCTQAPQMTIVYAPATKVWRRWQEREGIIHALLLPVRENDPNKLQAAKQAVNRFSDDAQIKREVDYTDRKVLARRAGDAITAKALGQIRMHVREAIGFVHRWIELQETRPGQSQSYLQRRAEQLRQEVWSRQAAALADLAAFEQHNPSLPVASGIACCRKTLENIRMLFDPEVPLSVEEPDPRHLLHVDLLHLNSLPLNDQWEPDVADPQAMVESLLKLIAKGQSEWWQTFSMHCERRDHEATARIIEYLEAHLEVSPRLDEFQQTRDKHIHDCQAALRRDAEETRTQVDNAVAFGLLREKEQVGYTAEINGIEMTIPDTLRFFEKHMQLRSICEAIREKRAAEVDGVRQRLQSVQIRPEHPAYERIHNALDNGDILTANEYIDMVLHHLELPELETQAAIFENFFPQTFRAIANFMEPPPPASRPDPLRIVNEIRSYARGNRRTYARGNRRTDAIGPIIDMYRVAGIQADQAADMIEAWFTAKKVEKLDEAGSRQILTAFGLNPLRVTVNRSGRRTWLDVDTDPIQDRNRCPVPEYGDNANGRYRILCVWDRPTEEDLLNDIGETSHGAPAFVFHFGRMTEQRRRDLARLCRERRRTFLVIDDTLVLYLCGERGSRLPVLFECTLPFTFLEPYTTTAGLVPPEMFYGRMRERDSIVDPMGSCFIYGGRQLGKTALLRDVERTFHAPQEGRIARWLDLKVEGIGYDRPIEHLLNKELKKAEVLPANLPDHTGVGRLVEHIQTWLGENEHSRILLLLDEADRFLESDGKDEFVRCASIKGLMDRTQRRFKVVFAGLHNVQRTAGQANHPLAHYGEPICIGPLLDHGERREARALIERPFTSIGYRFASSDLVTRLLSQTNYYPNLIQLYCNHLLRHVNHPHQAVFDLKTSPPYVITSRHVEEAYHSQDLRKAIRDRFMWTLQLDQRYEVIAYSIAYGSILDRERGMVNGFLVSWIRAEALTWWAQGFRSDTSEEYFRVLLDEMVGLGILRMVDGDRYALRSSNVISLMGTEEEIQAQLLSSREAPPEYEPATFRAAFGKANPDAVSRRSPLTALQESELRSRTRNGVSIIFGCSAAGIEELPDFLISTFGHEFFIHIDSAFDRVGFARHLNDLGEREKDGTTLMLISPTCPWSELWVDDALQKLRGLKSKTSFVHIAFVADPEAAWRWAGQHSPGGESSIQTISLKPWHAPALRQWLDDCGLPSDKPVREQITHVTGNWPILLQRFYQRSKADPRRWERYLEELDTTLHEPKVADELVRSLGLTVHEPRKVLRDLAALGEVSAEDLAGVIEDVPGDIVQQSLRWADLLSLVSPAGHGSWRIDPWVGRLLEASRE